jgi:hypothetical protein
MQLHWDLEPGHAVVERRQSSEEHLTDEGIRYTIGYTVEEDEVGSLSGRKV